ncbi:hypothetical protein D3C87_1923210 [compost metagenome]
MGSCTKAAVQSGKLACFFSGRTTCQYGCRGNGPLPDQGMDGAVDRRVLPPVVGMDNQTDGLGRMVESC